MSILKEKDIICPERVVAALFESEAMVQYPDMDEKIQIMTIISLNLNIINSKYMGFDSFIKMHDESKIFHSSLRARRKDALVPLYKFFLDAINLIDFQHEFLHPIRNRVDMLKSIIRESFSRKEYIL